MDRKDRIFQEFVLANGLRTTTIDFATRQRKYEGMEPEPITQEELIRTIEFTGFVDGYEGASSKFKFQDHKSPKLLEDMRKQMASVGIEMLPEFSGTDQERYERQYKLGFSVRDE